MNEVNVIIDRKQMQPVSQHLFDTLATHVQDMVSERVNAVTTDLSKNLETARASAGIHEPKATDSLGHLSVAGKSRSEEIAK